MIHRSPANWQTDNYIASDQTYADAKHQSDWQHEMIAANMPVEQLLTTLEIPKADQQIFLRNHQVPASFPVRATPSFISRIKKGDIHDPLLRQIAPLRDELVERSGYSLDPLEERSANTAPGFIQKYRGRALLIVAKACAIHCRYCFRRHFPYQDNLPGTDWQAALEALRRDKSITEVIYSGGDPLSASDKMLQKLTQQIAAIPHIRRLRIHSRLPVVLPSRIDSSLLDWLAAWPGQTVLVIHANHPNELNHQVAEAIDKLKQLDITLLNQAVLAQGVNDNVETLVALSERLFEIGVLPYYLHMLDKVSGTHQFAVSQVIAKGLIADVSTYLPGYLVPKLVEEVPGATAKRLL